MCQELVRWKVPGVVPGDADRRPWFVFHCFFHLLSRQRFQGNVNEASYPRRFVDQLPEEPYPNTADERFKTEDVLIVSLRKLAREDLRIDKSSNEASTLVGYISEAMDYDKWHSSTKLGNIAEESKSEAVTVFVERFRRLADLP